MKLFWIGIGLFCSAFGLMYGWDQWFKKHYAIVPIAVVESQPQSLPTQQCYATTCKWKLTPEGANGTATCLPKYTAREFHWNFPGANTVLLACGCCPVLEVPGEKK